MREGIHEWSGKPIGTKFECDVCEDMKVLPRGSEIGECHFCHPAYKPVKESQNGK